MTDFYSIQYISGLLRNPGSINVTDRAKVAALVKEYPYMAPLRYLDAAIKHKEGFSNETVLDGMHPYMGNWLQYCDLIDTVNGISYPVSDSLLIADSKEEQIQEAAAETEVTLDSECLVENSGNEHVESESEGSRSEDVHPTTQEEMQQAQHAHIEAAMNDATDAMTHEVASEEPLILPVYTDDYFLQQGVEVPDEIPQQIEDLTQAQAAGGGLMVMMSFTEWLLHFKHTSQKEKEENEEQRALKAMWQKEKLTAAMEEENEEIPEDVFEMAVNSITKEEDLASEPLANIYIKQGKYEKAIEMYRKLSLRNPQKSAYFAQKIEEILKEKQS